MKKIHVTPLSRGEEVADRILRPVMQWLTFPDESPQETHFWNNTKLTQGDVTHLDQYEMVQAHGDPGACRRWLGHIPLFHMPRHGGWTQYIVLKPALNNQVWYVGWITNDVIGISRLPIYNAVRVLLGPAPAQFFGVDQAGIQLLLRQIAAGQLGDHGMYRRTPLR